MAMDKRIRSNHVTNKSKNRRLVKSLLKMIRPGARHGIHSFHKLRSACRGIFQFRRNLRSHFLRNELCIKRSLVNNTAPKPIETDQQSIASEPPLIRSTTNPCVTNLGYFYLSANYKSVPHSEFTNVRKLASGINGDVFKYRWQQQQSARDVAVKMVRNAELKRAVNLEMNERVLHQHPSLGHLSSEDALTEIGVLSYLSKQADLSRHILSLHAVFADAQFTWVVSEFADGGELFDVAASGVASEEQSRTYMWQLLQAVAYLHRHRIGHRDISLENVLLKEGEVRLMDFGMSVQSHSLAGTPLRFFRCVGKDFYRAPECYVPCSEAIWVDVSSREKPGTVAMVRSNQGHLCEVQLPIDAVPGQRCKAGVWGYAAQPSDIFSSGHCLFILFFQCPAWNSARLYDSSFRYVYEHGDEGIAGLLKQYRKKPVSVEAMQLLEGMLRADPATRFSAAECLSSPWFAKELQLSAASLPVH